MTTLAPGQVVLNGVPLAPDSDLFVQQGSLDIQDAVDQESKCSLVTIDLLGVNHFSQDDSLLVYDGSGALAYAGWVTSAKEKLDTSWISAAYPVLRHTIQATDHHYLANKRRVPASYANTTAGAIVNDIIANFLADEGVYAVRNLLTANQSSVETDTTGFSVTGGGTTTLTRDTTTAWQGSASLKAVTDGTTNPQGAKAALAGTNYQANQSYIFSCYVKGASGTIQIRASQEDNGVTLASSANVTLSGSWQRISVVATMPASVPALGVSLRVVTTSNQAITFNLDGLMIEPAANGLADAQLRGAHDWELGGTSTVQTGGTVTSATFGYVPASDCLDALAKRSDYWWEIDQDRRLWFAPRGTTISPWTFDGSQDEGGTVEVENTNPQYRNRQYVGGGIAETSTQIETRIGDSNTQTWTMAYPLAHAPTVEVSLNGGAYTPMTVGIAGVDAQGTKDFYWNEGKNTISQDPSGTKLRGPTVIVDTLRVTYIGQFPFIALSTDDAQVTILQAAQGGSTSGYVEDFISDSTLDSTTVAFEVANSYLTRFAVAGKILTFSTRQSGLAPGQLLSVALPIHDLPAGTQMLIESVDVNDTPGFELLYTIKAIQGPVDSTWIEFFKTLTAKKLTNEATINLGSSQTLVTLANFSAVATPSATFTATVYACPIFPATFPLTLC